MRACLRRLRYAPNGIADIIGDQKRTIASYTYADSRDANRTAACGESFRTALEGQGRIANARAGNPRPFRTFGQVTTIKAPFDGTLSRLAITSI